ncbi:MAG: PIN domain-containing protein [Opitutaceae bacterium]
MKTWLVDTGPLVALLVGDDTQHAWAVEASKQAPATVLTCEAVLSEVLFLLKRESYDPNDLFALMDAGFVRCAFDLQSEQRPVRDLMRRYRAQPMALADACLVRLAELHPDACVWTLDRDFQHYRKNRRQTVSLVAPW